MRIAEIIGRCTLSVCHPSLRGAKWLVGVPLTQEGLQNIAAGKSKDAGRNEAFVIYDDLGAGSGDLIGLAGTFKLNVVDGQHSYEFEYSLPQ